MSKNRDLTEIDKLKARIRHLEKTNSWYFFALERLASLGDLHVDVEGYQDPKFIFRVAQKYLKQLAGFSTMAFYLVDESTQNFELIVCDPEPESDLIRKQVNNQIEKGNFAWALKQNRPLIGPMDSSGEKLILHALATKSRVRGMFVGRFGRHTQKIPGEKLHIISIILSNTAYAIENGSLYQFVSQQNSNLEQTVKKRTLKLEKQAAKLKKEIQDRQMLEEELKRSNEDLQAFASIASHDLQEPLRKVIMFGDRLRDNLSIEADEKTTLCLERMGSATARMQKLIEELLQFSRVSSKAKSFKSTDLNKVVREVLSDLETRITRSGARIEMKSLPILDADEFQMRQLFQNLVGNALKFHKKGENPVVKILAKTKKSGDCEIRVQDNGIGFEEKYIDRIFKPFERLHGRSEFEGTGMGLAICQKIVHRHGGRISAKSAPDQGCTFTIHLPKIHNGN